MLSDSDSDNSPNESTDSDPSSAVSDVGSDVYCYERMVSSPTLVTSCIKEKKCWNLATHHLRREIGNHCSRNFMDSKCGSCCRRSHKKVRKCSYERCANR